MDKKTINKSFVLKLAGIGLLAAIAIIVMIKFYPQIIELASNKEKFKDYINSFGALGFAIFILFEVLQVIIALIPGDLFHISAGFIYGMPLGFILAYFGEILGALIAFGIAKFFGADIVKKFVSEKWIIKTSDLINSAKGTFGILVLCLIPVIPKDVLIYVAGLTPVKPSRFLTVFFLSRIPDIFIKASGGAAIYKQDYKSLIIVGVALLALIGIGLLLKNKFVKNNKE
jgi:uncharacterized membrane protein YdjX (TVP38/TMEM64 family)